MYGRVHGNMFWIEKRIGYRNSFKTRLTAKLEPAQGGGTRIACKAGIAPFTTLFMYVWFVMFTFATFVTIATKSNAATGVPMFLLFGGALFAVGRYMARDEKAFLADYLRKVLVAREATEN